MFGKKTNKPQGRIDSLIGAGTSLEGDVTFSGGLRVDGEIKGNVRAADGQPATLVISETCQDRG
jgi:cytoskeletal protein CcmA (bactofilin family)